MSWLNLVNGKLFQANLPSWSIRVISCAATAWPFAHEVPASSAPTPRYPMTTTTCSQDSQSHMGALATQTRGSLLP